MAGMESKNLNELLKRLLKQSGSSVETFESTSARAAIARVRIPNMGVKTVTVEIAEEGAGLWSKTGDPVHPCHFSFPGGMPIPASKVEAVAASYIHVNFSPDGSSAILVMGEDVAKAMAALGSLRPASADKEAAYVVPLSHCLVVHARAHGD